MVKVIAVSIQYRVVKKNSRFVWCVGWFSTPSTIHVTTTHEGRVVRMVVRCTCGAFASRRAWQRAVHVWRVRVPSRVSARVALRDVPSQCREHHARQLSTGPPQQRTGRNARHRPHRDALASPSDLHAACHATPQSAGAAQAAQAPRPLSRSDPPRPRLAHGLSTRHATSSRAPALPLYPCRPPRRSASLWFLAICASH